MPQQTPANFIEKLKANAKADPRKALILSVLVVVMLGMWGKLIFTGKSTPAGAFASPAVTPNIASMRLPRPRSLDKEDSTNNSLQDWLRGSISPLQRNLFTVNLDYFPSDISSKMQKTPRPASGDGFWDQVAKSMSAQADQKKERQVLLENLTLQAQQLRLQSTMMGTVPKALLNEQLVKEGDTIDEFRVVRIEARRIVVEREGVKLEIVMK